VEWANGQPVDIYIMSIFFSNEFLKPIGGRRMGGGAQSQMVFGEDYLFYFKLILSYGQLEVYKRLHLHPLMAMTSSILT
jgi:hypothetical protein